ncbi:MAG: hypothetical protein MMC33_007325 [Icmadophila ericetorum]|nr:hypothetical protein [Icmadophila ericetorum]
MLRHHRVVPDRLLCPRFRLYQLARGKFPYGGRMNRHTSLEPSPPASRTWAPSQGIFFSKPNLDHSTGCQFLLASKLGVEPALALTKALRTPLQTLIQSISAVGRNVLRFTESPLAPFRILSKRVIPLFHTRTGETRHRAFNDKCEPVLDEDIAEIIFEDAQLTTLLSRESGLGQDRGGLWGLSARFGSSSVEHGVLRGARAYSQFADTSTARSRGGHGDQTLTSVGGVESEYTIPEIKLREAMLASRTTKAAYWRYSLYEKGGQKVRVHYCKSLETTERVAKLFLDQDVIGFDMEWKPQATGTDGIKKNVSLIQFASEERVALFHIAKYAKDEIQDLVSPTLRQIMENPGITKVGVGVKADCTRLLKHLKIQAAGIFELSHLYKLLKFLTGDLPKVDKRLIGLAQQVEEHLQLPLWKGEVRASAWNQDLNYEQIQYAASDSYAGLKLFHVLEVKRKSLSPIPPRPEHAELNLPIRTASGETVALTEDGEEHTIDEFIVDDTSNRPESSNKSLV